MGVIVHIQCIEEFVYHASESYSISEASSLPVVQCLGSGFTQYLHYKVVLITCYYYVRVQPGPLSFYVKEI